MKTFHGLGLFTAAVAMGTLCSAMPRDSRAPRQPPAWEERAAPGLGYGVEVGSPALPGRMLGENSWETCPKDTVACHLPRNWNCCPTAMPCCGPGCCAEGYRCVDARVGMCCPEGSALRDGVCVREAEPRCGPRGECGDGTVCCRGQCVRRCRGVIWWSEAAGRARSGGDCWLYVVVSLGVALANIL
ncbi:hypothetical protein LZ32DRAFT_385045 [Colletotrichum eremochloae]|nr:hypothetical protein LZ32DRAFT_385045 [Colletotrichum eremochloae]